MKRIALELLSGLATVGLMASSLGAEIGGPGAAEHIFRAGDNETDVGKGDAVTESGRAVVSPEAIVSTRSSFAARWNPMSQAATYRLDVSTSPSFDSYVSGYQGLEVGRETWRVVTRLRPGTTSYYRITGVTGTGASSNSEL